MKCLHLLAALLLAAPVSTAIANEEGPRSTAESEPAAKKTYEFPKEGDPLREVEFDEVKEMIKGHDSELLVVNFWATWCAPCVAELPYFAEVDKEYREKGVRIVGLTLDNLTYPNWPEVSAETMKQRGVRYVNFALDADPMEFVPWFADEWSGAIPATFYFDKDGRMLGRHLREVTLDELREDVNKHLPEETTAADAAPQSSSSTEKS